MTDKEDPVKDSHVVFTFLSSSSGSLKVGSSKSMI